MLPNDNLRLLVHLNDEQGQGLIFCVFAAAAKDPPKLLPVDSIVGLLQVDEGCVFPSFLALPRVDLS